MQKHIVMLAALFVAACQPASESTAPEPAAAKQDEAPASVAERDPLAAVLDAHSRRVVGWSMSHCMPATLVMDALQMALGRRCPDRAASLMHHSDRGSQYASQAFQDRLREHNITCSMSRKGNCWDNAMMESFFATLKKERVFHESYATREEARQSVFEYIELFYNPRRRHSALGYLSPEQFETAAQAEKSHQKSAHKISACEQTHSGQSLCTHTGD